MKKPNNILHHDVVNQLGWDMLLDSTRVLVKADEGVVTLTGTVPTYKEFLLAEDDAWGVGGVKQVDNELLVGRRGRYCRRRSRRRLHRSARLRQNGP